MMLSLKSFQPPQQRVYFGLDLGQFLLDGQELVCFHCDNTQSHVIKQWPVLMCTRKKK